MTPASARIVPRGVPREGQRLLLSELLWRVVYADGRLSEHEDYLTQKLATLLDLRPGYLGEARRRARGWLGDPDTLHIHIASTRRVGWPVKAS